MTHQVASLLRLHMMIKDILQDLLRVRPLQSVDAKWVIFVVLKELSGHMIGSAYSESAQSVHGLGLELVDQDYAQHLPR